MDIGDAVAGELRHTTDTKVRVLRPGNKVGRTLYDAETGELVGMMDTPELAAWLCETVWREVRSQALPAGEEPIQRELCEQLDARYGIESRGEPAVDDEPIRGEENVAMAPARYTLSNADGANAVELGILLGARSLVAIVDGSTGLPVAWAHFVHAADVARALSKP